MELGSAASESVAQSQRWPVAVVEDAAASPASLLDEALDALGFHLHYQPPQPAARAVILLDLGAFEVDSPVLPARSLVEHLLDRLAGLGWSQLAIASTSDSSSTWCENRQVFTLAELFGYVYETPLGTPYDVIDLSENLANAAFPPGCALEGSGLSADWIQADLRIVVAKACTDPEDCIALGASTFLAALPHRDKDLAYRLTFTADEALHWLLEVAAPSLAIVDLSGIAHGAAGRRRPRPLDSHALVASPNLLAADAVAAAKLGAAPWHSRLWQGVTRRRGAPRFDVVRGDLTVIAGVELPDSSILDAARALEHSGVLSRMLPAWLQRLDESVFPLKHPLDAKVQAQLGSGLLAPSAPPMEKGALALLYRWASTIDLVFGAFSANYHKENVRQRRASVSPETLLCGESEYQQMEKELQSLQEWLDAQRAQRGNLRPLDWQKQDRAVVFSYSKEYPVSLEEFTSAVDISRTIQLMNDYIGGTILVRARDSEGRPVRQVERNLYLPQPNYTAFFGAKEIDVSKIESVHYSTARQRMFWKTIKSENGSALADDGIVTFEAIGPTCTRVSVYGRQQFALPPILEAARLDRFPELERCLIDHAYDTFFSRTFANFEALLEGRDVAIGVAVPDLMSPDSSQRRPIEALAEAGARLLEALAPLLQAGVRGTQADSSSTHAGSEAEPTLTPGGSAVVDEHGFSHFSASSSATPSTHPTPGTGRFAETGRFPSALGDFAAGYLEAVSRDWVRLATRSSVPKGEPR